MNLHQKLIEIRKCVTFLKKEGRNKALDYNYVSSTQALTAVREKMDELGVLLVPSAVVQRARTVAPGEVTKPGMILTEIEMEFTWVNAEKPDEKISCKWQAQGTDNSERGIGKGYTYGLKYFILIFFQIPSDKDDPDHEKYSKPQRQESPSQAPSTKQNKQEQKPKSTLPDIKKPGWEDSVCPFKKAEGRTWFDLSIDAKIDGTTGRKYLEQLANWKENADVAKVAAAALKLDVTDVNSPPF